jgi:proline iminopeptidase
MESSPLFPEIEPYETGMLRVDDLHTIYWEQCGNPLGVPILFVHGGPGAGCSLRDRRFFDPEYYRIVLFDQRGSGRSTPSGETRQNTTELLAADMEKLRETLQIDQWHVFGGSWGSTLSVYYAEYFPKRVLSLTLRGVFLMTQPELDWWFEGVAHFFPEHWADFVGHIPDAERGDVPAAYERRLQSDDPEVRLAAAKVWTRYESSCYTLRPLKDVPKHFSDPERLMALARIESHYFQNNRFSPDDLLLRDAGKIAHIPTTIIQGRYDVICPPRTAVALAERLPQAKLWMVDDAGHSSQEPGIASALIQATNALK